MPMFAIRRQYFLGLVSGVIASSVLLALNVQYTQLFNFRSGTNAGKNWSGSADDHDSWDRALKFEGPTPVIKFNDQKAHHDNDAEAKRLAKEVRVLVWVMTSQQNLDSKARNVRDTWGQRVNKLVFFSSETNKSFPTIGLNVSEGRKHLTAKTMGAFRYIYENYLDDADWFMKVDDDTFVIVENLRYFLSEQNTEEPVFFGQLFKPHVKQGYYSGGGGYVLSKEALRRFGKNGHNATLCRPDGGSEDIQFSLCMERLGVKTANTTDALGRTRFHCLPPEHHLSGFYADWYREYDGNGAPQGQSSISDYAITFHYISPGKMQEMEFFLYHLNPYGIIRGRQNLNQKPGQPQTVPKKDKSVS